MIYRPCPKCGAKGTCWAAQPRKNLAWFECANGHLYTTRTADNGLLLEVRS